MDGPSREFAFSTTPLRRVVTRSSRRTNGWFASRKMARAIPWSSSNEFAFLALAELDPSVARIYAQAVCIPLDALPGRKTYVPDFLVQRDGFEIFEVKPDEYLEIPTNRQIFGAACVWARSQGATFGVAKSGVLKLEPRYSAIAAVLRRLHDDVRPEVCSELMSQAQARGVCALAELVSACAKRGARFEDVLALAARNLLWIGLDQPITLDSLVRAVDPLARPHLLPAPAMPV